MCTRCALISLTLLARLAHLGGSWGHHGQNWRHLGAILAPPAATRKADPGFPNFGSTGLAIRVAGPAIRITGPALRLTGLAVRLTGPAIRLTGPAIRLTGLAIRLTGPAIPFDALGPSWRYLQSIGSAQALLATVLGHLGAISGVCGRPASLQKL